MTEKKDPFDFQKQIRAIANEASGTNINDAEQSEIGNELRLFRKELGLSRTELYKKMNEWSDTEIQFGAENTWRLSEALITAVEYGYIDKKVFKGYFHFFLRFMGDELESRGQLLNDTAKDKVNELNERVNKL